MWEILQKKVYKTSITDLEILDEPTQQLRTELAKLDHVVIAIAVASPVGPDQ